MKRWSYLSLFCGLGGMSLGFERAGFRCVGAFDSDSAACADHKLLTGVSAVCADLSTLSPEELRAACTGRPDVLITSPPCKAFSGCLPARVSKTTRYTALSDLSLRGVWLTLEAWADAPPSLIVLENVPRIISRGRHWLNHLTGLLRGYGYAVRETTHDCGELGALAQRRRRFLLVARHISQVSEFLYEPVRHQYKSIGEVLGVLPVPVPGGVAGGPMHLLPRMSPLNWIRLALIPAGKDWKALPEKVALAPRSSRQNGCLGVNDWGDAAHTVVSQSRPNCAWASVTDPRVLCPRRDGGHGVTGWDSTSTTVIASGRVHNGPWQCADPRINYGSRSGALRVEGWADVSHTVIGAATPLKGQAVADPRIPVVMGSELDLSSRIPVRLVICAADGTWHRPMTTLELAALQGLPVVGGDGCFLKLDGKSHQGWRQRIGNAVPPPAAEAIAQQCKATLSASCDGELLLSSTATWVKGGRDGAGTQAGCSAEQPARAAE